MRVFLKTQAEFCRAFGYSESHYNRMETGNGARLSRKHVEELRSMKPPPDKAAEFARLFAEFEAAVCAEDDQRIAAKRAMRAAAPVMAPAPAAPAPTTAAPPTPVATPTAGSGTTAAATTPPPPATAPSSPPAQNPGEPPKRFLLRRVLALAACVLLALVLEKGFTKGTCVTDSPLARFFLSLLQGEEADLGGKSGRLMLPDHPLEGQKKAPYCDATAGEVAINGGCWLQLIYRPRPQCPRYSFEWNDGCFKAVPEDLRKPVSVERRDGGQ